MLDDLTLDYVTAARQRTVQRAMSLPVQGLSTIEKVASVAGQLGSAQFMSTAPKGGTNLQRFVTGLSAYIEQQGYSTSIDSYGPYRFNYVRGDR